MADEQELMMSTAAQEADAGSLLSGFWPAMVALVDELGRAGDFDCRFGFQDSCGNNGGCDPEALSRAVQQRFEGLAWPIVDPAALRPRAMLDLVEFFHECVAFPVWDICGFCEQSHVVSGDSAIAREKYTNAINALFRRFNQPFTLEEGKVSGTSGVAPIAAAAEAVREALDEADVMTGSHEAAQAVDPVYTALQSYLRTVCDRDLLGEAEATLAINTARALFVYLDATLPDR